MIPNIERRKFPIFLQNESKDCGATCLKMIAKFYGKNTKIESLRKLALTNREGSSLQALSDAAEKIGFSSLGVKVSLEQLCEMPLPCIAHWDNNHYVVITGIPTISKLSNKSSRVEVADPAFGKLKYSVEDFLKKWISDSATEKTSDGILLLLEPSESFQIRDDNSVENQNKFSFAKKYLFDHKKLLFRLILGLLIGSVLQLIAPLLMQNIVDVGIRNKDISFIYLILIAQLILFIARTFLEYVRTWILLALSTKINISLVSDFFIKLMNLPISYFDVKITGDIIQRINDHKRVERFLTTTSLNALFAAFSILVLGTVLAFYSISIFIIFLLGSFLYFGWVILFLKKREGIDYKMFSEAGKEQGKIIELINGMQEIKLHNAEQKKRFGWENIQSKLYQVSIESLKLEQLQTIGSNFINELKNIIIIFLAATLVIDGHLTVGMMMAVVSIVGSLNGPIVQFIFFMREAQDARISLNRLAEIHGTVDELEMDAEKTKDVIYPADITVQNLMFKYPGGDTVLKNINLTIPANKVTAIVGSSGSGKTTLLKLLLKFYEPTAGEIYIGALNPQNYSYTRLADISHSKWRGHIGSVMQEGYIFNDTIAHNVVLGDEAVDEMLLYNAARIANILEFVESLPLKFNTIIGTEGVGMSTGQKQRVLIARSIYKNPHYLFFDEATSALDSNNEKEIVEKLNSFFEEKTVVIIAHRLSTVMNADQIIVLEDGEIVERGTHHELIALAGNYQKLVRNQLQLEQ